MEQVDTRAGVIGGTLFCIFGNIHAADIFKTIVLAAIGAVTSFIFSFLLRRIMKRRKQK